MQLLPYNHEMVHMFSKETDYVIHTRGGRTLIAGLFKWRDDDDSEYAWVTAEGMRVIENDNITHWAPIQF